MAHKVQKVFSIDEELNKDFVALKEMLFERFEIRVSNPQCLKLLLNLHKERDKFNIGYKRKPRTKKEIIFFNRQDILNEKK